LPQALMTPLGEAGDEALIEKGLKRERKLVCSFQN